MTKISYRIKKKSGLESVINKKSEKELKTEKETFVNYNYDGHSDLYSPLPVHFPDKVRSTNKFLEESKHILPPLDLSRAHLNTDVNHKEEAEEKSLNYETEEWIEILKIVGMSHDEINRISKNKILSKLFNAIDLLNKVIIEKNLQIRQIKQENDCLNVKISGLKNDNITLTRSFLELKQQVSKNKENFSKFRTNMQDEYLNTNNSMTNNTSRADYIEVYNTKEIGKYYDGNYKQNFAM